MLENNEFEYFINCSSPKSLCEVQEGFLGSAVGVCNRTSELCLCPPGFNGEDLWGIWNDCHVNLNFQFALEASVLFFSCLGLVLSLLALALMIKRWKIPSRRKSSAPDAIAPKFSDPAISMQSTPVPATVNSMQQMDSERKRKRNTLGVMLMWVIFFIFLCCFSSLRVGFHTRIDQRHVLLLLSLSGLLSFVILGLWLQTFTWFSNLPSLRLFADMFPTIRNNVLVQSPYLLRNFIVATCVLHVILSSIVVFALPVFAGVVNRVLAEITFTLLAFEISLFGVTNLIVCNLLLKIFRTFSQGVNANSRNLFASAERTVRAMRLLSSLACPIFACWFLVTGWNPTAFRYTYFFVSVLLLGGAFVSMVSMYLFLFRMGSSSSATTTAGNSSPKNERRLLATVTAEES